MKTISASLFVSATLVSFLALAADRSSTGNYKIQAPAAQPDRQAMPQRADCHIDQDSQSVRMLLIAHTLGRSQPICLPAPHNTAQSGLVAG